MIDWVEIGNARLACGDCLEILPTLGQVDAVITDPPYSARTHDGHDKSANGHQGLGNDGAIRQTLGYGALSPDDCARLAEQFSTICSGWVAWMHDHVLAPSIHDGLSRAGRYVFAPLPYYAPGSRVRLSGDGPSSWTIWITVARTTKQSRWGTLPGGYVAESGWRDRTHMGGKPLQLMEAVCRDYSRANHLVLDPFMGSGTTGVACMNLGRKFIGVEIDKGYFEIACERIEQAQKQVRLFA